MSIVYLVVGFCVLGVAAIVPTVLDEVRRNKAINGGADSGSRRYLKGRGKFL